MAHQKKLGPCAQSGFIEGCANIRLAVHRQVDRFAWFSRSLTLNTAIQFSPSRVAYAGADGLCVVSVCMQSHDCAGTSSSIRLCWQLSPVSSGLRCKGATGYETASEMAQVMCSFRSLWKIVRAKAYVSIRVLSELYHYIHAHNCDNRYSFWSLRTL